MATEVELPFADGDYLFTLHVPQILELQRACGGVGIFTIYGRVLRGRYLLEGGATFGAPHESDAFLNDIYETVRLGLIAGGKGRVNGADVAVSPGRARELIETYCHPRPLKESWDIAAAILSAKIEGYEPQKKSPPPPKSGAARKRASTKPKS